MYLPLVSLTTVIAHFSVLVSEVRCQTRATPKSAKAENEMREMRRISFFIGKGVIATDKLDYKRIITYVKINVNSLSRNYRKIGIIFYIISRHRLKVLLLYPVSSWFYAKPPRG